MLFTPANILGMWFRGLLAVAILVGVGSLFYQWYDEVPREQTVAVQRDGVETTETRPLTNFSDRLAAWRPGLDWPTAYLAGALLLLAVALAGQYIASPRLFRRPGTDEPHEARTGEVRHIARPDGTQLHVELYGPADGPPIVLTHGWNSDSAIWYYLKRHLSGRYRLILWDLPGMSRSTEPGNRDYSMEKLAGDLRAVLDLAGGRPAVLLAHSMGGMITLTFCRLFPDTLGSRVAGLILAHTTYTNPLRTTQMSGLYTALQKPVIEPLLHLTIWLSPVVWVMNLLSYLNGSAHRSTERNSFAGTETRGQLDFAARYVVKLSPAVLARGAFGMLGYDATGVLPTITVPVLVLPGDRDPVTKPEASERVRSDIPGAQLTALAPTRHMGLLERNAELIRAVDEFCSRVGAGGPTGGATAPAPVHGGSV